MDASHARELVDQVRTHMTVVQDAIVTLWQGRAWEALGYPSWDALCDSEFRIRLPVEQRRALVGDLTAAGMSSRAVGSALGVHHDTVNEDRQRGGNPPPADVIGLDGKHYTVTPSGIPVPEGDNPHDYETACHVSPTGGAAELRSVLRSTDRLLANYYTSPSATHLDVIDEWLAAQQRRIRQARKGTR